MPLSGNSPRHIVCDRHSYLSNKTHQTYETNVTKSNQYMCRRIYVCWYVLTNNNGTGDVLGQYIPLTIVNLSVDTLASHRYINQILPSSVGNALHTTLLLLPTWINFNPSWINNHMPSKVWDKITYSFPIFIIWTVKVCEWIINFIPCIIMDVITYPCWDYSWSVLIKGPLVTKLLERSS